MMISRGLLAYVLMSFVPFSAGLGSGCIGRSIGASVNIQCSGQCDCFIATNGVSGIISDGLGNYRMHDSCKWILTSNVTGGEIVIQRKTDSVFEMEEADTLYVSDYNGILKEVWRPGFDEKTATSTGYMKIEFSSDESVQKQGFELEWHSCGPPCPTAYDASMLTDAFNENRDHFGCIEFVST